MTYDEKKDIWCYESGDDRFPEKLKYIPDPPKRIYVKGVFRMPTNRLLQWSERETVHPMEGIWREFFRLDLQKTELVS